MVRAGGIATANALSSASFLELGVAGLKALAFSHANGGQPCHRISALEASFGWAWTISSIVSEKTVVVPAMVLKTYRPLMNCIGAGFLAAASPNKTLANFRVFFNAVAVLPSSMTLRARKYKFC